MPSQREIEFARQMKGLLSEVDRLGDQSVKRVLTLLSQARKEIAAEVAGTEWEAYQLPRLREAVERAMVQFGEKYGIDLRSAQTDFWDMGIARADIPLNTLEVRAMVPSINIKALEIAQGYSSDLVSNLTADAIKKINQELMTGILGQKTPFEVMTAIGKNLDGPSVFKSIAVRAEVITRTETGRIFEMATQARLEEAEKILGKKVQKMWQASGKPTGRPDHQAIDGQVRDIDEPFDVAGEKLMFPGDPGGSAWNTINCGCRSVPYMASWQ